MSIDESKESSNPAKLQGVVKAAAETIAKHNAEKKKGKKGWIAGLVGATLALIAIAVLYWRLRASGKELAKLRHERDVARERAVQAKTDMMVAENTSQVAEALARAEAASEEVAVIRHHIQETVEAQRTAHALIDSLKSWEDIERYLNNETIPSSTP